MMSASPLPLPQFHSFGVAICDALNELHTKDQIHTDIRPQNIHKGTLHLQIRRANQEQEVLDEAGYADLDLTVQLVVGGSSCRESPRHRRQGEGTGLDRVGLILFSSFLNDAGFLPSFKIEVMTGTKVEMIASNRCWQ